MEIRAVALDLDGTLLNSEKKISQENINILKELERRGVKIFIVTGRTYISAKKFAELLDLDSAIIAYNGAKVVNYKNDEVLFDQPLNEKIVKEVLKIARAEGFHVNLYQNNKWYVEKLETPETIHYANHTGLTPVQKDFDTFEDYFMTKVTIQDMENSTRFNEFCEKLAKTFESDVYTAKSQEFLFEILDKNVNKGITLKKLLKSYDILPEECVAFGDAFNDLEMLTVVKYGVAMGNSSLKLKERVNYVTDTNDNNGVAKFLRKYFF